MAKKAHTATDVTNIADFVITDPQDATRSVRFGDLPFVSQTRMIAKAVNELLSDSGAMSKEQMAKMSEEEVVAKKAEAREKRWNSLLTGEFVVGQRGPRLDPVEAEWRRLALIACEKAFDKMVAAGKAHKDARPKKLADWQSWIDQWKATPKGREALETARANVANSATATDSDDFEPTLA